VSSIFLIADDGALTELSEQPYSSEDLLQQLLAQHPGILSGDSSESAARRFVLVAREMSVPDREAGGGRFSMDHLLLDQDAVPTFVETKRSSDTRIRREIVGQMLDYAANGLVYWPVDAIRDRFEATHGEAAEAVLTGLLAPETSVDDFWKRVTDNLRAGQVRLVFVADRIPMELQRVIEFLNEQMNPAEVLGIEVRQYVGGTMRTLVPHVMGQTARAQQVKGTAPRESRPWDRETFLDELSRNHGDNAARAAAQIIDWSQSNMGRCTWGKGQRGSFNAGLTKPEGTLQAFSLRTDGVVQIDFGFLMNRPPFDNEGLRLEYVKRLNRVEGVNLPDNVATQPRAPTIPLSTLAAEDAQRGFFEAIGWFGETASKA